MSSSFNADRGRNFDEEDDELLNDENLTRNDNLLDYEDDLDEISYQDLKEKFYSKYRTSKLQKLNRKQKSFASYNDNDDEDNDDENSHSSELTKADIQKIHQELNIIHNKLVEEFKLLQDREIEIKKRECELLENEIRYAQYNELNSKLKFEEMKLMQEDELEALRNEIKEKNKENKRLNESFKTIKQTNDILKNQNLELQEKNVKLEKQYSTLNHRLANLQKIYENDTKKQSEEQNGVETQSGIDVATVRKDPKSLTININHNDIKLTKIIEILSILVDWINNTNLKKIDLNMPLSGNNKIIEKFCKILPLICDFLSVKISAKYFLRFHRPFLEFIYWSLLHCDSNYLNQVKKTTFMSVYRRIGEELYKPLVNIKQDTGGHSSTASSNDDDDEDGENEDIKLKRKLSLFRFIKSDNSQIRLLSCLIIIRTLNQVDYLMNVFDVLRADLNDETNKKLFLYYYGVWVLLKWCKLTHRPLLQSTLDTYLQLCVDSPLLDNFLSQCSNETWFSHISVLVRQLSQINNSNNIDFITIEKLSVILQRLSKIKANRKYFEMFQLNLLIQEIQQKVAIINSINSNDFLKMNLQSIINNLSSK